jgi:hypothetical protein
MSRHVNYEDAFRLLKHKSVFTGREFHSTTSRPAKYDDVIQHVQFMSVLTGLSLSLAVSTKFLNVARLPRSYCVPRDQMTGVVFRVAIEVSTTLCFAIARCSLTRGSVAINADHDGDADGK